MKGESLMWIQVLKAYAKKIAEDCGVQVILEPSEVRPERFHIRLAPLPHPVIVGNGRVQFRVRASAEAEIPPTDRGISDSLGISLRLAEWFDETQGGIQIADDVYAIAYHQAIREDDDLFTDLAEPRSYSYAEHWICRIEFDYTRAAEAVKHEKKET
jgi:hypothetical protein